jgi:hypothetical protein
VERMREALLQSAADIGELDGQLFTLRNRLHDLDQVLNGNRSRQQPGEKHRPIIYDRLFSVARGIERSTQGPTATHRRMLEIATQELQSFQIEVAEAVSEVTDLARRIHEAGGPWLEGEGVGAGDH